MARLFSSIYPANAVNSTAPEMVSTSVVQNLTKSDECKRLHFEEYIPWNNTQNIVSMETEAFFDQLKGAIILPFLFLIGGPANIINLVVFYKQGLKERINLCLFTLALADELYLITCILMNAEKIYLQFAAPGERNGPMMVFLLNHNLIGFFGFTWVSQIISAIIASERCFCVVSPLRSHTVLTTRTMAVILATLFIVIMPTYFVVATRFRMVCVYDPVTNVPFNMIDGGEFYYRHQKLIDYLDSIVLGMIIPGSTMLVVLVTTAVTIVKLRQAMAWRSETSGALSTREVALTKMLVANSILFLVCITPFFLFRLIVLLILNMKPGSRHHNLYLTLLWILEIPSYINSCFNIIIYYSMGSRYRDTLKLILRWRVNEGKDVRKP